MTIREALVTVLTSPEGYCVDLFGSLCIYRLEDGRYGVSCNSKVRHHKILERLFDDPGEAVDYFLERRLRLQLGFDFEKSVISFSDGTQEELRGGPGRPQEVEESSAASCFRFHVDRLCE